MARSSYPVTNSTKISRLPSPPNTSHHPRPEIPPSAKLQAPQPTPRQFIFALFQHKSFLYRQGFPSSSDHSVPKLWSRFRRR
ncbi:hypothetical protein CC78DRAFT_241590 [Lojkania enalia]|uniref:Uncharacterized protein n=1 Tax=Lojkania enalia TaxID=147567 RepID=A0A9P4NAY3_9PLEO|nr:hypothetical protein CC78DRAFT_241590 [Didymosphaeria enalia]